MLFAVSLSYGQKAQIDLPITWNDSANVNYTTADFGGTASSLIGEPNNVSNLILSVTKPNTAADWAGVTLSPPAPATAGLGSAIPFVQGSTLIKCVVYSPDSGITVRMKAEDKGNNQISVETNAMTTVANAWDTLTFDFSNQATGTAAINYANTYDMLSIFFNFGVTGATAGTKTYWLDDVWFVSGSGSSKAQIDLPITWNDTANVDYTTADFGGTASMMDVDPGNASNIVLNIDKSNTAADWAGTTLGNSALATAIPFAANANLIKVRFYSPDAGITVRLKAEDAGNNQISVVTDATTTVANAWDTLTFDFSNQATGTSAINYANSYNMVSLFPNFGVDGPTAGAKTYYVDDVWFSTGGGGGNPTGTQVTFKVDLSDYTGNDTAVFVNGTFNNWCGTCNPMTDANNDDIWELSVNLPDDSIEFKYTVNGVAYEAFVGGESCTKTTGAFTNRFLILDKDTVLPVTCFASCSACTGTPTSAQVTFKLDMNSYPDTFTTAYVNGTFNGWCGTCSPMTDADSDGVWEATVGFAYQDTIDFKYTLNGWQFEETLTSGPCTQTDGNFTNRHLKIMGDTTMPVMCWEECVSCDQVGFAEINNIQEFKVVPNPTSGVFTVSMISDAVAKLNLSVYNMAGQKVYQLSEETAQLNEVIDLGGLNNGVYLIELSNSSSTMLKKLVLSK